MASKDLTDPVTTPLDLYALLSLPKPSSTTAAIDISAIKRAYRKASLTSHPDRAPPSEKAAYEERFYRVTIAHDILRDEDKRNIYDARIERDVRQQKEKEAFTRKRRVMMEELTRREKEGREGFLQSNGDPNVEKTDWRTPEKQTGVKRHAGSTPLSAEQQREVRRLETEAQRRKKEFEERRKRRRSRLDQDVSSAATADGPTQMDREGHKNSRTIPKFSFSPSGSGRNLSDGTGASASPSAPGGSLFMSTMAKLKEKQRQKEEERARQQGDQVMNEALA